VKDDDLKTLVGMLADKFDGVERRRRISDELEERLSRFMDESMRSLRRALWVAVGLGAAASAVVTTLLHFIFRW
jgi:hypothetical protein